MSLGERLESSTNEDPRLAELRITRRNFERYGNSPQNAKGLLLNAGLFDNLEDLLRLDLSSTIVFTEISGGEFGNIWILGFGWRNNPNDDTSKSLNINYFPRDSKYPYVDFSIHHRFWDDNQLSSFELSKESLHFKDINSERLETVIFDLISSAGFRLRPVDIEGSNIVFLKPKDKYE